MKVEVYVDSDYAQQTSERKCNIFHFYFIFLVFLSSSCFTRQRPDEGKLILQLQPNQRRTRVRARGGRGEVSPSN